VRFREEKILNELVKQVKPTEIKDVRVYIVEFSEWSEQYYLRIKILLDYHRYSIITEDTYSESIFKKDMSVYFGNYINNYLFNCGFESIDILKEPLSTENPY
jgi:hypothetical protein